MPANADNGNRLFFNADNTTFSADTANVAAAASAVWPDGTNTGIIAVSAADMTGNAWNLDWEGWTATAEYPLPTALAEMMEK